MKLTAFHFAMLALAAAVSSTCAVPTVQDERVRTSTDHSLDAASPVCNDPAHPGDKHGTGCHTGRRSIEELHPVHGVDTSKQPQLLGCDDPRRQGDTGCAADKRSVKKVEQDSLPYATRSHLSAKLDKDGAMTMKEEMENRGVEKMVESMAPESIQETSTLDAGMHKRKMKPDDSLMTGNSVPQDADEKPLQLYTDAHNGEVHTYEPHLKAGVQSQNDHMDQVGRKTNTYYNSPWARPGKSSGPRKLREVSDDDSEMVPAIKRTNNDKANLETDEQQSALQVVHQHHHHHHHHHHHPAREVSSKQMKIDGYEHSPTW